MYLQFRLQCAVIIHNNHNHKPNIVITTIGGKIPAHYLLTYIARLPRVTLIAATGFWCNTYAMLASNSARRYTPISLLILLVPSATLFQYPLLGYARSFVYGLCLDPICRASRWNSHAPFLIPFLIGHFPRGGHKELVLFHFFAHVWPVQLIIDD